MVRLGFSCWGSCDSPVVFLAEVCVSRGGGGPALVRMTADVCLLRFCGVHAEVPCAGTISVTLLHVDCLGGNGMEPIQNGS